jgi:hypothetical protein
LTGAIVNLSDLQNLHKGETVWVLGSGPSLNYIDGSLFDDKTTVSTNFSARALGVRADYAFTHYHANAADLLNDTMTVVTIEHDTLTYKPWGGSDTPDLVLAPTPYDRPPGSSWNPLTTHKTGTGQITYGSSSLHGAIHLAAHLGASHIILVGADAGFIDDVSNADNYPSPTQTFSFGVWNRHTVLLKQWLRERYGVNIHSLNPFINLNLEGHTFKGVS